MTIVMTNEFVTVYSISSEEYERYLNGEEIDLDSKTVYVIPKLSYSSIKMQRFLASYYGEDVDIHEYYVDNGITMEKKQVNSVDDIQYYKGEDDELWPSPDYIHVKKEVASVNVVQSELIALDNELNSKLHIENVLSPIEVMNLKRLYDTLEYKKERTSIFTHKQEDYLLSRFYVIPTKSALIVRNNKKELTSKQLVEDVFVTIAEAGMNVFGEKTYFVKEYKITEQDVQEITTLYRDLLKQDGVKAKDLEEEQKIEYYSKAVRNHINSLKSNLTKASFLLSSNGNSESIVTSGTYTWPEYTSVFLSRYGYPLIDIDNALWKADDSYVVDARTIHNGLIVPMTIEHYQLVNNKVNGVIVDDPKEHNLESDTGEMTVEELLTPLNKDSLKEIDAPGDLEEELDASDKLEEKLFGDIKVVTTENKEGSKFFKQAGDLEEDTAASDELEEELFGDIKVVTTKNKEGSKFFKQAGDLEEDTVASDELEEELFGDIKVVTTENKEDVQDEEALTNDLFGRMKVVTTDKKASSEEVVEGLPGSMYVTPKEKEAAAQYFNIASDLDEDLFSNMKVITTEPENKFITPAKDTFIPDIEHIVKEGETLSIISSIYKITESFLRTYNNLDTDELTVGDVILIPSPAKVPEECIIKDFESSSGKFFEGVGTLFNYMSSEPVPVNSGFEISDVSSGPSHVLDLETDTFVPKKEGRKL